MAAHLDDRSVLDAPSSTRLRGITALPILSAKLSEGTKLVTIAGVEGATARLDDCKTAEAVILQLEKPFRMVERLCPTAKRHEGERKHGSV